MQYLTLKLTDIVVAQIRLRDAKRGTIEFENLKDSIVQHGLLEPIAVRPLPDGKYELVNGVQRYSAHIDLAKDTIPCVIHEMSEMDGRIAQLVANVQNIPTTRIEYLAHIKTILNTDPTKTVKELANMFAKSEQWINDTLALDNLDDKCKELLNAGKLSAFNALALVKVPEQLRTKLLDAAITEPGPSFTAMAQAETRNFRNAMKAAKDPTEVAWTPTKVIRKKDEIEAALTNPGNVASLMAKHAVNTDVASTIEFTLKWVLSVDPDGVTFQQKRDEEKKKQAKDDAAKRALERAQKKRDEANAILEGRV